MKEHDLLISARDFLGRSRFPLADRDSMSALAIYHSLRVAIDPQPSMKHIG
jgi:hypothetical protein